MKKLLVLLLMFISLSSFAQSNEKDHLRKRDKLIIPAGSDTLSYRLDYTNYCLYRFYNENKVALFLELTGIGLVVCGEICSNISDTQMSTLMYVTGGIFVVTGAILHLNSYKWMKKAYIIPIENGIAVGINIEF